MRYKILWIGLILIFQTSNLLALTAKEIIKSVDKNLRVKSFWVDSTMKIHLGDDIREKKMISYFMGNKFFLEFLSPPRDKGVRYLRIDNNLWMYIPSIGKIIKIAGHMLRQSMMGSDFSYEDALGQDSLLEKYEAILKPDFMQPLLQANGKKITRECYVIELVAKVKRVTYFKRKLWIDKEYMIPLKEDLFAKSGKLLKINTMGKIKKIGNRYYPMYSTMKNVFRKNSWTEFIINDIKLDINLDKNIFTQRNLKR